MRDDGKARGSRHTAPTRNAGPDRGRSAPQAAQGAADVREREGGAVTKGSGVHRRGPVVPSGRPGPKELAAAEALEIAALIGTNITAIRKARRLSSGEVAGSIAKHQSQITHYENGRQHMSAATVVQLARALGCKVSDIFKGWEKFL